MQKREHRKGRIRTVIHKSITALLVGFVVTGSVFGFSYRTTYALDGGGSLATFAKEMADALGWLFGDMMIAAISGQTYEWSQEGFGTLTLSVNPETLEPIQQFLAGDTTFLEDPNAFFGAIGDEVTKYFIGELELIADSSVEGIREGIAIMAQRANDSSQSSLTTTLPTEQLERFVEGNFASEGGWGAWLELTSNPQNYYDGAMFLAMNELNELKNSAVERNKEEVQASGGFLTIRQCETLDDLGITDPQLRRYATVDEQGCANYREVTPGQLIGEKVSSAITTDLARSGEIDEITEIIASLITTAIDQLVQKGFSEITKVTQNFGTPSDVEREGQRIVNQLEQDLYNPDFDGTGMRPPQPANPNDGTTWEGGPTPEIDDSDRGDYWAQISWDAPSNMDTEELGGYIIYRFEDDNPMNSELDDNEELVVIATKSREDGTLRISVDADGNEVLDPSNLTYVDSTLDPTKQYGYIVIAFDVNYNRSSEVEDAPVTIVPPTQTDEGGGEETGSVTDIVSTIKLMGRAGEDVQQLDLPDGTSVNAYLYEAEISAYWVPEMDVPLFDVVVTPKLSNLQVGIGQQYVFAYGTGGNRNGTPIIVQFLVPVENVDKNIRPYVDLEIRTDPSNKVRESSDSNNDRKTRVELDVAL